jgi:hypothetical protein
MWLARKLLLSAAIACLLVACDAAAPGGGTATTGPTSSAMEFRGQRPCADCTGIESWLRLEQEGERRRFRLVEDGVLQARDARGLPLPAAADDVMMAVTFDTAR